MTEILKIGVLTLVFQLLTSLSIALINCVQQLWRFGHCRHGGGYVRITSMELLLFLDF